MFVSEEAWDRYLSRFGCLSRDEDGLISISGSSIQAINDKIRGIAEVLMYWYHNPEFIDE